MDVSLSTQLANAALSTELNATMVRKGLEAQKLEGQNVLALLTAATPSFADPALGTRVDVKA